MFLAVVVSARMTVLVWNMLFASCIPGTIAKWNGVYCLLLTYHEYDDDDMEYLVCGKSSKNCGRGKEFVVYFLHIFEDRGIGMYYAWQ